MKSRVEIDGIEISRMIGTDKDFKLRNKKGWLTPYALSCSYVERYEVPGAGYVRLYMLDNNPLYSVLVVYTDREVEKHALGEDETTNNFYTFKTLTEARKYYLKAIRDMKCAYALSTILNRD